MTTNYPDSLPDGLGDLKEIRRLPAMAKTAPGISWGVDYLAWAVEKRLDYAERLAAAMNNAADVLQTERNAIIKVAQKQEELLKATAKAQLANGELMQNQMMAFNAERQKLNEIIVELQAELREQRKRIKVLERADLS